MFISPVRVSQPIRWRVHTMLVLDVGLSERDVLIGHVERGMAEHFFESKQVPTGTKKFNRESVPKGVR